MNLSDLVAVPIGHLVLVFIAAGARFTLPISKNSQAPTIKILIGSILWALFIIIATYPLLKEYKDGKNLTDGWVVFIVAFLSFFAGDILQILIRLFEQIRKDPLALLRELLNKWKPSSPEEKL